MKEKTGSTKGAAILKDWDKYLSLFWQLVPPSEEDTPEANAKYDTTTAEQVTFQSAQGTNGKVGLITIEAMYLLCTGKGEAINKVEMIATLWDSTIA